MTFKAIVFGFIAIGCVVASYHSPTREGAFGFGLLAFCAIVALGGS